MELRADGTFTVQIGSKAYAGKYELEGESLRIRIKNQLKVDRFRFTGTSIVGEKNGSIFERETSQDSSGTHATGAPITTSANSDSGLTIDEMARWIKRQLPPFGTDHIIRRSGERTNGNAFGINKAVLSECVFTLEHSDVPDITAPTGWVTTVTIPLKDIDLSRLSSQEAATWPGYTQNKPSYVVSVYALADAPPFKTVGVWAKTKKEEKTAIRFIIPIREEAPSRILETYLRSAATLCGAPDIATAAAKRPAAATPTVTSIANEVSTRSIPTTSPTSTSKSISNADVIAMVQAGLSELVIANAIHQTSDKSFDLSPSGLLSLKKGKVSDSLIVVMQTVPAVAAPPPVPSPTTPPKYDSSLTRKVEAEKSAAVFAATGCTGIEMMGLYKNEIFNRAMGGGITEWLVKIRNNTAVTKLVTFGWRDEYGQEQTGQVQVRGGDIASPRVDMTQARYIAPTTSVRLVSCQ